MDQNDTKQIQENHKKTEQNIAQRSYYMDIKEPIMSWAKGYSENNDKGKYLYELLRKVMTDQKLSRLQSYALVGLVNDFIYSIDCMNDEIDSTLDSLYSAINGECISEQVFSFPDDPPNENVQEYAWSNRWKLWQDR